MKNNLLKNRRIVHIIYYIIGFTICMILLFWRMELWKVNFSIPFLYDGDALLNGLFIKSIIDEGWYLKNNFVGMPFGLDFSDYPMADGLHLLILKMMTLFTHNYALILNLYFLLTFILSMLTTMYVFNQFQISYVISIFGSLIFTFMSYHFLRGEAHLFLAAYYIIPLVVMVAIWIYLGRNLLIEYNNERNKLIFKWSSFNIISIVVCLIASSTGVYYAFFGCFFLLIAGISCSLRKKNFYPLITSMILVSIISVGVFVNILPSFISGYVNGINLETAHRSPIEAEIYGMKITQLFIPLYDYGITPLKKLISAYSSFPLPNEGSEYLGIIGCIGFLFLLLKLIKQNNSFKEEVIIEGLSRLNIFAILLGTIGGLGSIFAIAISPQIRAYNRISIYIAFFSIFSVVILIDKFYKNKIKSKVGYAFFYLFLTLILIYSIFDQVPKRIIPDYIKATQDFNNDKDFIQTIEDSLPSNAMIFQLPYVPFPENPPVNNMGDYQHFKAYLHSKNLRWSYGAIKGRKGDLWQREVVKKPLNEFVETISLVGFDGIYIDRFGYSDSGKDLEAKLTDILKTKPIVSKNNRFVFFNMTQYNNILREKFSEEKLEEIKDDVLHPVLTSWRLGFSGLEGTPENNWRWCSSKGELVLVNSSRKEKDILIEMAIFTGYKEYSNLKIEGDLLSENLNVNSDGTFFSKRFILKPGKYVIRFSSDAKRVDAPNDPRFLVFRIANFRLKELKN